MKKQFGFTLLLYILAISICLGAFSGCESKKDDYPATKMPVETDAPATKASVEATDPTEATVSSEGDNEVTLTEGLCYTFDFLDAQTGKWESAEGAASSLFGCREFEPGTKKLVYFRIANTGTVDFTWDLGFEDCPGDLKLGEVIGVFTNFGQEELTAYPDHSDELEGYWAQGTLASLLNQSKPFYSAELYSGNTAYFGIMLEMDASAGQAYSGLQLENVALKLTVAQPLLHTTSEEKTAENGFSIDVTHHSSLYENVLPGDLLQDSPSVCNTGAREQYVRVTITVSDLEAFQSGLGTDWSVQELFADPNWGEDSVFSLDSVRQEGENAVLILYANRLVAPGETVVLYQGVSFPAEATATMLASTTLSDGFTVYVLAEAVYTSDPAVKDAKAAFEYADTRK